MNICLYITYLIKVYYFGMDELQDKLESIFNLGINQIITINIEYFIQ